MIFFSTNPPPVKKILLDLVGNCVVTFSSLICHELSKFEYFH